MSIFRWLAVIVCVLVAGFSLSDTELTGNHSTSLAVASGQVGELTLTPSPASTLDPRFATATSIITTATAQAQANMTANVTPTTVSRSPSPIATHDPGSATAWFATATSIIATATAQVRQITLTAAANMPPSPTPDPTLSPQEIEQLKARWLAELEAASGFSHLALNEHIDWLVDYIGQFYQLRDSRSLEPIIETLDYDGSTYMAIIADGGYPFMGNRFLIFRITNSVPVLIHSIHGDELGGIIYVFGSPVGGDTGHGLADRNGNGFPDIALGILTSGNSLWVRDVVLLEIRPDDAVVNISPHLEANPLTNLIMIGNLIDIDGNGVLEVEAWGCVWYPANHDSLCNSFNISFYYAWDGTAFQNITSTLDETYWPTTVEFWERTEQQGGCLVPDETMYVMLIEYIARDKLEEGWVMLEPRLRWDTCPSEILETYQEDMDELLEWVGRELEIQQFGEQWLAELETVVGFSHPALQEIVWSLMQNARYNKVFRLRGYELDIEIEQVAHDEATYMAVLVSDPFSNYQKNHLRIFRIMDEQIMSIPNAIQTRYIDSLSFHGRGFADRNGNGRPDLAIDIANGGLILLEIGFEGTIIDISPDKLLPRSMYFVDLDGDGIAEIEEVRCVIIPSTSICKGNPIYLRWNGTAYEDITTTLDESFWTTTAEFWERANRHEGCLWVTESMYLMLIEYIARSKLDEGWARLEPRLCSPESDVSGKENIDELREWVAQQLVNSSR